VDLVREGRDDKGSYIFSEPYVGGAAIGGPPVEDLLAKDWRIVEEPGVPAENGGERAQAAELAEIAEVEADQASGAVGCGAGL
jgi:hypothetical protein